MTKNTLIKDPYNLIITGVGGQGNVVMSVFIGNALLKQNYFITIGEIYGASQRGGSVVSFIRISRESQPSPFMPNGSADLILGMEPIETLRILKQYGNWGTIVIVNPRPVYPAKVASGEVSFPGVDIIMRALEKLSTKMQVVNATEEAQKLGNPIFANVILLGALIGSGTLPLDKDSLEPLLRETFPRQSDTNLIAFNRGVELVERERKSAPVLQN